MPRMFPQLFPVGFTVSHHRKTRHAKILSRMRILDLGRLRKVDPRRSDCKSQNENTTKLFQPAAPADHSSRGEAALRLTAEGWYLGKVCPSRFY